MLPVALKNVAKALRYDSEGVNTLRGDALVDDVNAYQELIQSLGFTPTEVSEQYKRNNSLKNYEQHILKRRSRLLALYAMAFNAKDNAAKKQVLAIKTFQNLRLLV